MNRQGSQRLTLGSLFHFAARSEYQVRECAERGDTEQMT